MRSQRFPVERIVRHVVPVRAYCGEGPASHGNRNCVKHAPASTSVFRELFDELEEFDELRPGHVHDAGEPRFDQELGRPQPGGDLAAP